MIRGYLSILLTLAGVVLVPPSLAHDIGVSQAELSESQINDQHQYRLRVAAGAPADARFPAPVLPVQCTYSGNPRGTLGAGWKTYEFQCDGGLKVSDELNLPWQRDGIMLKARWADGSEVRRLFSNEAGQIRVSLEQLQIGSGSWHAAAKRYTSLGIEHILEGYDHLLFVFALLVIVGSGWRLVKTITAFTLAHSITLALATLGFVVFPSRPVEAAIALSIVFLAVEILHRRDGRVGLSYRMPWIVAFSFGLLHGFGFAGALSEIGLPQAEIPIALLFFNIGVELGQLLFVAVVLLLRKVIEPVITRAPVWSGALPAYFIGTMAMFWLIDRVVLIVVQTG